MKERNIAEYRIKSDAQNVLFVIIISLHGYYKSYFQKQLIISLMKNYTCRKLLKHHWIDRLNGICCVVQLNILYVEIVW